MTDENRSRWERRRAMVNSRSVSLCMMLMITACGFPQPENVATVGGEVHGLWQGADGVALRLQASGIDTVLAVRADGSFRFPDHLVENASYSVTVVSSPVRHGCSVESGSTGTVAAADVA